MSGHIAADRETVRFAMVSKRQYGDRRSQGRQEVR
jgi:hypothetical protein